MTVENGQNTAPARRGGSSSRQRTGLRVGVGAAVAAVAGTVTVLLLGFSPLVGIPLALALRAGAALVLAPPAPRKIDLSAPAPTTVVGMLDRSVDSTSVMQDTMRSLTSRVLWQGSPLDEHIHHMLEGIVALANSPVLRRRTAVDGDVQMLYLLATDYLPTIVNLAVENDRMHVTFSGRSSKQQVERNIAGLEEQAGILAEALDRIENDVVRGTTQSVQEHTAFLRDRFERMSTESVLDFSRPAPASDAPQSAGDPTPSPDPTRGERP